LSRTITRADLRTLARRYADVENSTHVTDAELNDWVNISAARLHSIIADKDEDYLAAVVSISASAGASVVDVVTGKPVYKILNVAMSTPDGGIVTLNRFALAERAALDSLAPRGDVGPQYYRMRAAGQMDLAPPLAFNCTISVVFIASFVNMTNDADTYEGFDGWEDWVAWDVAIKIMIKEETDTRAASGERDRAMQLILSGLTHADRANPPRVVDVSGRNLWGRYRRIAP
jgi:hypothetical protein